MWLRYTLSLRVGGCGCWRPPVSHSARPPGWNGDSACCASASSSVIFPDRLSPAGPACRCGRLAYPSPTSCCPGFCGGSWALSGWRTERVWCCSWRGMGINTGVHRGPPHPLSIPTRHVHVPAALVDASGRLALAVLVAAAWHSPAGRPTAGRPGPWLALFVPGRAGLRVAALPACSATWS